MIGKSNADLNLQDNGALTIISEGSSIFLSLSSDDVGDDDWVWMVQIEKSDNSVAENPKALYCCPEDGDVHFYVEVS